MSHFFSKLLHRFWVSDLLTSSDIGTDYHFGVFCAVFAGIDDDLWSYFTYVDSLSFTTQSDRLFCYVQLEFICFKYLPLSNVKKLAA